MGKNLIELSGLIPDRDIEIKITGMRPGEKEYEELLTGEETVDRTAFERIFVARKDKNHPARPDLDIIKQLVEANDTGALIRLIFEYIPEHKFHSRI